MASLASHAQWHLDPSLFIIVRGRLRDGWTRNDRVWHSMTEYILTCKAVDKTKRPGIPSTRNYNRAFREKYDANGMPTNAYINYEPPTTRSRLRDYEGRELRKNAEKSMQLCEYFMDLVTQPGG